MCITEQKMIIRPYLLSLILNNLLNKLLINCSLFLKDKKIEETCNSENNIRKKEKIIAEKNRVYY